MTQLYRVQVFPSLPLSSPASVSIAAKVVLPIMDAPDFNEDVRKWKSVTAFGAKPNDILMMLRQFRRRLIPVLQQSTLPTGAYIIVLFACVVISERLWAWRLYLSVFYFPALRYEQEQLGL